MSEPWTESNIEQFVDDYYDDLLIEKWLPEHEEEWESFMTLVVKPTGRAWVAYQEAPLEVWNQFVEWHRRTPRLSKPFTDWIIDSLDNECYYDHPSGGDGDDD